ncbi:MAG: hypothetical protein A4E63_03361 [Syntrophorhabdus sp. PtaU1.Bin050]|nr:MAG: hypothetical protein A4E63_03361 [Syntrophorhabdus sp. PtaU1.Bin050]
MLTNATTPVNAKRRSLRFQGQYFSLQITYNWTRGSGYSRYPRLREDGRRQHKRYSGVYYRQHGSLLSLMPRKRRKTNLCRLPGYFLHGTYCIIYLIRCVEIAYTKSKNAAVNSISQRLVGKRCAVESCPGRDPVSFIESLAYLSR